MTDQRYVDYIKANKGKFSDESIAEGLRKAGVPQEHITEAFAEAARPPAPPAYMPPPPPAPEPPVRQAEPNQSYNAPQQAAPAADAGAELRQAAQTFDIKEVFGIMMKVLTEPAVFFRQMPKHGGWAQPALFCTAMIAGSLMLTFAGVLLHPYLARYYLAGILLWPIYIAIALAVSTLVAHVLWMILGSHEDLETSFRCVAYLCAVAPVSSAAHLVPFVGTWVGLLFSLYGLYLFVHASVEVHGIPRAKAMLVFVIFAVLAAFMALISLALVGWRMFSRRAFYSPSTLNTSTVQQNAVAGLVSMLGNAPRTQAQAQPAANLPQAANQMMAALGGSPNTKAVDGRDLKSLLPETAAGMPRADIKSGKSGMGQMQVSNAEAVYRSDAGSSLTLTIADLGSFSKMLTAAWAMTDIDEESTTGFKKTLSYRGSKALEEFNQNTRSGHFETVVKDRFLVKAEGSGVDMKTMQGAVDQLDFNALESMAK